MKEKERESLATRVLDGLIVSIALALTLFFGSKVPQVAHDGPIRIVYEWIPSLKVQLSFMIDGLGLLFALIICGAGTFVALYSGAYLAGHEQLGRFRLYLTLFMLSMVGLVLSDNLVALFVFWELTTITSYLLIGFDHKTGFFEIVIAARDTAGAGFKTHLELPDNRLICHHATVLYVGRGAAQSREDGLIIAKHQHMGLFAMLEVVVNALFVAEPLNEVQV